MRILMLLSLDSILFGGDEPTHPGESGHETQESGTRTSSIYIIIGGLVILAIGAIGAAVMYHPEKDIGFIGALIIAGFGTALLILGLIRIIRTFI